jgi:hypothetical protein
MDINDFLNRKLTKTGEMPNGDNIYLITEKSVNAIKEQLRIDGVSHSMTGDGMNSLEFFDMIKKEWCVSEEQHKPFWNDVLTFARKYHKERKEYCG